MESFDDIKNLWKKNTTNNEDMINPEFIENAMNSRSVSITARLLKSLNAGLVLAAVNILLLLFNTYFYRNNNKILLSISVTIALSFFSLVYFFIQKKKLIIIDIDETSLKNILVKKIKFFKSQYYWVLHLISISMGIFPFGINLTMESGNGFFNITKIYLLVGFYVLVYLLTFLSLKISNNVYLKMLENALENLNSNVFNKMEKEIRKSTIMKSLIIISLLATTLFGIWSLIKIL